jgi:hypothetical protein
MPPKKVLKSTKTPTEVTDEACNAFLTALRAELATEAETIARNEAEGCMKTLHELEAVVSGLNKLAGKKRTKTPPKGKSKKNISEGK